MRLILLVDFINQLLNLSTEELNKLNHYLEGLLSHQQRKEVQVIMDEEREGNIILPEIDDNTAMIAEEIKNDELETTEDIDNITEESNNADCNLEQEKNKASDRGVVDQLRGIKSELRNFKEEVVNQKISQGGDKMSEEKIKSQCSGGRNNLGPEQERPGRCCPTIIEEKDLPDISQPMTKPVSCIKVVHENLVEEYPTLNPYPIENFTINKLSCCFEQVLIRSERTDCCYPGVVLRACGCVEYGTATCITTEPPPPREEKEQLSIAELRERDIEFAYICCDNCICIDEIIWWDCWTCDGPTERDNNIQQERNDCNIIPEIRWENAELLTGPIELIDDDTTCDCSTTPPQIINANELNLANKAAVVFEGTLILSPDF